MADEDLLYGDLNDGALASNPQTSKGTISLSLVSHTQVLEERVRKLEEENENLKRNIGTLFRTAKAEIQRKDAEIASLTQQLERLSNQHLS